MVCASMEVIFAAKTQTLAICNHFSPSSSSSRNLSQFPHPSLLRREFLSCGSHWLRPFGLQFRKKCRKFGFHIQFPRISCQASLENSVIAIFVFATLAAIPVHLNYFRRENNNGGSNQISDACKLSGLKNLDIQEDHAFSKDPGDNSNFDQIRRVIPVQINIERQVVDLAMHSSTKQVNFVPDKNAEDICRNGDLESNGEEAQLPEFETNRGTLKFENTSIAKISQELDSKVVGPTPPPFVMLSETRSMDPSFNKEANETIREDPSAFYGERCPSTISFHLPVQNNIRFFPLQRTHMHQKGADRSSSAVRNPSIRGLLAVLACFISYEHANISEYLKGRVLLAFHKEHSANTRKQLARSMGFSGYMERKAILQKDDEVVPGLTKKNGIHVKDKNDPCEYLNIYNRWLRDGRLIDCIELLESLDRKNLLDMDKVYHTRFFRTCQSQKAVKEAFRFVKLIKRPTLSTFNMLLSVCASSQDSDVYVLPPLICTDEHGGQFVQTAGAFQVLPRVKKAGLKADCKLYTTLISTCAKSGKVDAMFEVFHEMVNAGVEPNVHTYGALIDGCAKAGQVAKAFGAYGIMRSKNVMPDRVVFNALITACGQSGAVHRAFDVLAEMRAEPRPIDPDHVTIGALMKTCSQAGQVDQALEVYKMVHQYNIKGTPDLYTIAVNSCSQRGDLDFALSIYNDMRRNGIIPDEVFLSALIDVAGHAGKLDIAFEIIMDAKTQGIQIGNVSYSSLMGAYSNAKNWQKALELYEDIKAIELLPTVSTLNALMTALCDGDQLQKSVEVLEEMRKIGVPPNTITYSILQVACEKKSELELGFKLLSQAKVDGVVPNLIMCKCFTGLCLRRFEKAASLGEPILSLNSGNAQINNQWTSWALTVYRETISAGVVPTMEVFSQVLGCLRLPYDISLRKRLIENLGVSTDASKHSNICSLLDGFGEYDPRSFSLLEEAASLGIVPCVSFKESLIVVDTREFQIHTVEVYILTILRGLKHRLAAGARLPNITILITVENTQITSPKGDKMIKVAGRIGQAVGALLRRLGLPFRGNESFGKIRISGLATKRWLQPKLASPFTPSTRLAKGIKDQQRNIRLDNLSLD